ncbi:MAG: glutamine synthetase family protein [Proteobacteria bacterium]|nr:glutamine synthetase family protein [Pseudomonadota bacterium]
MERQEVEAFLSGHDIRTVICAGTDPAGVLRGKRMPVPYFLKAMESGLNFAWFIMKTTTVDDVLPDMMGTGVPDVKGLPDLATLRLAPWEPHAAVVLVDWVWPDGSPCPFCPRSELKRQVARLRKMGLAELFALEFEFYLMPKPVSEVRRGDFAGLTPASRDIHCYSIYEGSFHEPVVRRIRECFDDVVEGCAPEWGQGQFEINLHRSDALDMADTVVLFKTATKQIAAEAGLSATFMAKWHENFSGNSGHIHQSFSDAATGKSACWDARARHNLSPFFRHYIAGQLDLLCETTLFVAPFVNSYKRFQDDSFAGMTRSWSIDNRTAGLRVINTGEGKTRLEHRIGGADLNPYTAFAMLIGAGLRGVEKKLTLPKPAEGNAYFMGLDRVPHSLEAAADLADATPAVREILPAAFVDNLLTLARFEAGVFRQTVTDLELRRYYEMA